MNDFLTIGDNLRATPEYLTRNSPSKLNSPSNQNQTNNKPFISEYPDYQITPCETEITHHYDMDEHKTNVLQQSSHRGTVKHSSRYRKQGQVNQQNAVATNLGEKYLSIVKK